MLHSISRFHHLLPPLPSINHCLMLLHSVNHYNHPTPLSNNPLPVGSTYSSNQLIDLTYSHQPPPPSSLSYPTMSSTPIFGGRRLSHDFDSSLEDQDTQELLDSLSDSHHSFADDISCSPSPVTPAFMSTHHCQLWDHQQPHCSPRDLPSIQVRQYPPPIGPTELYTSSATGFLFTILPD